jgi:protease-4
MSNRIDALLKEALSSYAVLAIIAILIGGMVVPPAINATSGPDGTVAVVTIDEGISGDTADQTVQELTEIRRNDSIDAVVLRVDSGGGGVSGSAAQYRAVKRLSDTKPVVTSVRSMAASGAYYTILPSDKIYAEASSLVGHVGVIALFSSPNGVPSPMTSGPDKASGATTDEFRAQLETLKRSFVSTVLAERGEEITLSRTEIEQAKIYSGAAAVENGYIDEIGGLETAINAAAEQAGLDSYETARRDPASVTVTLTLASGTNPTNTSPLLKTPGVDRVRYLAIWGTPNPADNATRVITDGAS